jgi:hypothetical protein
VHHHCLRSAAVAILLASAACPIQAAAAAAAQTASNNPNRPIIVTAPLFRDIQPERTLDEETIASYGVSTIDELLGEVQGERGDEDQPLILVNGVRIKDISEIGALPVEALRSVEVLPRGLAVRAGGKIGQRVISLTLKRQVRSATLTAAHKLSTGGHWNADRGEAILTSVHGPTRANIALRVGDESSLLESQRGIIQPGAFLPYAIGGNVVGYPNTSGEIDPLLTALAGQTVTVVPLPTIANPALGAFTVNANHAAVTDIGQFRSLRPQTRTYDLNGTFATQLAPWLNASATAHFNRGRDRYERGLPNALFVLSPTNPASPFTKSVGLGFYGKQPLIYRTRHQIADANLTLNADWGSWNGDFNVRHSESRDISRSDRQVQSGSIPLADSINPFATDLAALIPVQEDSAKSRTVGNLVGLLVNGPAFDLPGGQVQTTFEGKLAHNHLHSSSTFSNLGNRNIGRSEQSLRSAVIVPIASSGKNFLSGIGDLSASAEFTRIHYSDADTANNYGFGLSWDPRPILHVEADLRQTKLAPPLSTLGDPIVITPDVRVFDPLTGETVDVSLITGGNPNLRPETDRIRRISAILRLVPRLNLQANAEYTDTDRRNFLSSLPEASAAIMLAFPERFIREGGVLTTTDLRPVNFDSDREKRLRWGLSMNVKLGGGGARAVPGTPPSRAPVRPNTLFQLTANHTIVFSDKIVIRPGLPSVDLLSGGAIGIASGRVRHQLDGTAALTSGGLGVRAGVAWRGKSTLESRINGTTDTLTFSPLLTVNLRAFADVSRIVARNKWAKGLRLSLDVLNLTNDRQKVRDSLGNTPLQYQPGYRDPLGRTIEIELRKVF